ncbi:aldehyde dehydrogenase [Paenibacillus sp. MY03]|uniref:aldehyde dehydrogenase n=1 Tax=Paenibacillus sp. MY03 TaxID=302980 RepID=UPI000B3CB395|nr:aldehyde dehydrogenase [Paenibacillus sp. MY03]OUS74796.1 aldehyde dehydrogenase [Paenibacillus sp. MY03]
MPHEHNASGTGESGLDAEAILAEHRRWFERGATADAAFRIGQLRKLKEAIAKHEAALFGALYKDLRKSEAEAFATEIGLVLGSITYMIKHIRRWMKPRRVKTPLTLFGSRSRLVYEPYGTVLIIGPFNYPVQLVLEPLVGAIAAGNCAVVKPSEVTPHVSAAIRELIADTFDPAYVRVVEGDKEVTSALIHAPFDYIFFTGSTGVGRIVMEAASRHLTPIALELGGKSPAIIDATANLELAAKRIVWGKLINAGQTCIAPDYLLVHESVRERLSELLRNSVRQFYGDDPATSEDYGRIVSERQYDRLAAIIEADGKRVVWGGQRNRSDLYLAPTLIDAGQASEDGKGVAAMEDELFGPILPMLTFARLEEAINFVRGRSKPLALYLFTEDAAAEQEVMGRLSFGGGCVNDTLSHIVNHHLPFGGVGSSGIGAYHGKHSFELFSHRKSLLKRTTRFEPGLLFPPYKGKLKWARKVMK